MSNGPGMVCVVSERLCEQWSVYGLFCFRAHV